MRKGGGIHRKYKYTVSIYNFPIIQLKIGWGRYTKWALYAQKYGMPFPFRYVDFASIKLQYFELPLF